MRPPAAPVACLVVLCYYEKMPGVLADNNRKVNHARYVWFEGYVKRIEKKHPGVSSMDLKPKIIAGVFFPEKIHC